MTGVCALCAICDRVSEPHGAGIAVVKYLRTLVLGGVWL